MTYAMFFLLGFVVPPLGLLLLALRRRAARAWLGVARAPEEVVFFVVSNVLVALGLALSEGVVRRRTA